MIPNGTSTYQNDVVYMGHRPDRIVIDLVGDKRMTGAYTLHPFRFSHLGLSYLALKVIRQQIPRIAYEPNFTTNDGMREYFALFEVLGMDIGNKTKNLTPELWASH